MNARMPSGDFPGYRRPALDFLSVRDQLRALPFYRELDLSVARSIAAGTQEIIELAGNSFYVDPIIDAAGNSIGGVAVARFEDTRLAVARFEDTRLAAPSTPFTIRDNFNARIPFTRILIENPAQAGKRLRIIYGVDVDFVPGFSASVSIAGTVNAAPAGYTYATAFKSTAALAALTAETIFTPAANVNGAVLWAASGYELNGGTGGYYGQLVANNGAPANMTTGDVLSEATIRFFDAGTNYVFNWAVRAPVRIAAGKGLYSIGSALQSGAHRQALYTLL